MICKLVSFLLFCIRPRYSSSALAQVFEPVEFPSCTCASCQAPPTPFSSLSSCRDCCQAWNWGLLEHQTYWCFDLFGEGEVLRLFLCLKITMEIPFGKQASSIRKANGRIARPGYHRSMFVLNLAWLNLLSRLSRSLYLDNPSTHVPLGWLSLPLCSQICKPSFCRKMWNAGDKSRATWSIRDSAMPGISKTPLFFLPAKNKQFWLWLLLLSLFCLTLPNTAFDFSGFLVFILDIPTLLCQC